jgi:hypothetical protein
MPQSSTDESEAAPLLLDTLFFSVPAPLLANVDALFGELAEAKKQILVITGGENVTRDGRLLNDAIVLDVVSAGTADDQIDRQHQSPCDFCLQVIKAPMPIRREELTDRRHCSTRTLPAHLNPRQRRAFEAPRNE